MRMPALPRSDKNPEQPSKIKSVYKGIMKKVLGKKPFFKVPKRK